MKRSNPQFTVAACVRADHRSVSRYLQNPNQLYTLVLDFGYVTDPVGCSQYLRKLAHAQASCGNLCVRMMIDDPSLLDKLAADNPSFEAAMMILALPEQGARKAMAGARKLARQVFFEVYSEEMALRMIGLRHDGLVLRGNEAGGICANMSNPTLLRRVREKTVKPIWVYGGISVQSALAHAIGGADGVILSDALMLIPELAGHLKEHDIRSLKSGVRTRSIDIGNRMHIRVSEAYPEIFQHIGALCLAHDQCRMEKSDFEDSQVDGLLGLIEKYRSLNCFVGEEIAWADELCRTCDSLDSLMEAFEKEILTRLEILRKDYPLAQGNALASAINAKYPILQGPMTHVSDCPDFLAAVAKNGAIPFAALGTCNGEVAEQLLSQTRAKMEGKPWGVGIIGFAPKAIQDEQFEVIRRHKPDMAIVAGGRPQHYKTLQELGIMPFLHIPVPSMIANFYKEGVRHFIFEGRGCGGHIGPINSYTLWQSALVEFQKLAAAGQDLSEVRIALAGGIYDAVSAAMASAFTTPLLEHGVQFCFIVGTAYLFSREIIESCAISPVFQKVALSSCNTVIMEGAAGHALRCAQTPLTFEYSRKRVELINEGLAPADVQLELENLNIGRLRLASKGAMLTPTADQKLELIPYSESDQEREGLYMIGEVATLMADTITMADLHRTICIDAPGVVDEMASMTFQSVQPEKPAIEVKSTDVAIIGMSAMLPQAQNLDEFWHNVLARMYCIRDVSKERWDPAVNYNPDPTMRDMAYSTKGGFLGEIPINCMEYGIPPGSMYHVEPSQLLALEAVKQALADAGYEKRDFDREKTSVIFGFAGGGDLLLAYSARASLKEYMHRAKDIPDDIRQKVIASVNDALPEWTEDTFPGVLGNIIAGRVANRFNFNGLNFTMDAACASSMAALKVACQELVYGTTKTVVVGGIDASQHPFGFTCFSKTKALSIAGQSRPFSQDADGIVLGEGVGVMVLKRLSDAIKDNDCIYAVVKGIGGASDGKGSGMTVPVARGQKLAIDRAYDIAGFKMDTVDLIEAHGTGTTLGDRVELETLHEMLQHHGATQPLAVGSVKSAIGHTKGAAGIIGVIKAALALHHKVLPAHVNVENVHPAASNPKTRLYINMETRPWLGKAPGRKRRAGASAFGFGGTNFHTVLEEYDSFSGQAARLPASIWPSELFLFGAKDTATLVKRIDALIASLDRSDGSLAQTARQHHKGQMPLISSPIRLAVRANSLEQLKEKLTRSKALIANGGLNVDGDTSRTGLMMGDGIWGLEKAHPAGPLTALFPGQGAQRLNMLKDLAVVFPVVRECLENANFVLAQDFFPVAQQVLSDYIYPPVFGSGDAVKEAMAALTQTTVAQPALAAVEMALLRLLTQFNVKIGMAAGHSFGELTALWAAGVLTDQQLLTLAGTRGRCMAASSDVPTGMTAVQTDRDALKAFIDGAEELSIANHNTPKQVVVSGSTAALEQFEAYCREQKLGYKRLPVSQGFHSPFMADAAVQWQQALSAENVLSPTIPVFSNMTASPYDKGTKSITTTLGRHLRNGVLFVDEIEAMHAAGARTFLEIGPGAILTRFVDTILGDKPHQAIAVQPQESKPGVEMLLDTLGTLFVCGYDIDLQPAFDCRIIAPTAQRPEPSATIFMVNGGSVKPTVAFKAKKKAVAAEPSRWQQPPQRSVPVSAPASKPSPVSPVTAATPPKNMPSRDVAEQKVPSGHGQPPQRPKTLNRPAASAKAPISMPPTAMPALNDQEKIKKMKYFQKSMNLFLETQERFHKQRLEMMERMWRMNQQLFQHMTGPGQQAPMPMEAPVPVADSFSSGARAVIDNAASQVPEQPQPVAFTPDPVPGSEVRRPVEAAPIRQPAAPKMVKTPEPVAIENKETKGGSLNVQALLFDVVSERTQYPVDMLAPDQQIEADLGIDSIKRVEIISMLQEIHPAFADIGNEKYFEDMAQLKTLGDIVNWLEERFGGSPAAAVAAPVAPSAPAVAPAQSAAGAVDFKAMLFDVVSERTQYPVDMLAPDQQIEADLGIDSIKRVEIISMLQEIHPAFADIANEKYFEDMAQLKTLGDIVSWLEERFGGSPAAASATPVAPSAPSAGPVQPAAGAVDFQAMLFNVVSERTQYPVDMLAPDQQIEADLGIDSIKRVEIISMLQETHPAFADIGNEKYFEDMAQLKTLGDIVNWLEERFGGSPAAAGAAPVAPSAPAQPAAGAVDFQAMLFNVVSERTQYPVDMLDPDQQIEADLGIDSIKRVEIISMLQETHPAFADISNEKYFEDMAQLKTLGDIVRWLEERFGGSPATGSGIAPVAPVAPAPVQGQGRSDTGAVDCQTLLFNVISERTQYPVDMLDPDQQIEADLGIDSIKRVEIISMLQETHPAFADVGNEKYFEDMAQLKTLGDIVRWLESHFGGPPADDTNAAPPAPIAPTPSAKPVGPGPVDYQTLLFNVISERTQYPVDMLDPDQQIEADLGIDSIKRVEIISMLQETHPSLADISNEKYFEDMAQLKTLGDIVAWIEQRFGNAQPEPDQPPAAEPKINAEKPDTARAARKTEIRKRALEVLSEMTMYPAELVKMEMLLDVDLGVDPHQFREITRSLAAIYPGVHSVQTDLSSCQTVQELVDWTVRMFQDDTGTGNLPVTATAEDSPLFHRYLLRLVEKELDREQLRLNRGVCVILDGGHPIGTRIQTEMAKQGAQCVRVVSGPGAAMDNDDCLRVSSNDEVSYQECYQRIKKQFGLPGGVLNLLGLGKESYKDGYQAVIQNFLWAKTIGKDPDLLPYDQNNIFWISVSGMGGDFGLKNTLEFQACQNGLHGITKCLFHEWPGIRVKTIDIHPFGELEVLARSIIDECKDSSPLPKEVAFSNHRRYETMLLDRPIEAGEVESRFNSDSVFLITGGAQGITADVAALLAELYSPTLIITGRTPLPERSREALDTFLAQAALGESDPRSLKSDIIKDLKSAGEPATPALVNDRYNSIMKEYKVRQNIARMQQLDAKVFYHACDCTNEKSFSKLIRSIYSHHQKIDGVIHAAGYLKDGLITQKNIDQVKRVLDTKVEGASILMRELDFDQLDFIVFFSSVAGRLGNQGQSDYAAANEIVNKIALKINHRWPGKATAINWGPWEGEGMVSDQVKKQFAEAGVYLLPRLDGARMLNQEINLRDRAAEVVIFGADHIEERLPVIQHAADFSSVAPSLPFMNIVEPVAPTGNRQTVWGLMLDQTAPYLNDHRVNGVPVLPVAIAMELMAQAAVAAKPGYRFRGIHELRLIKGITFDSNNKQAKLAIMVDAKKNGSQPDTAVDVRLALPEQGGRSNYQARVMLSRNHNGHIPDFSVHKHSRRFEQTIEDVYAHRLFQAGVFRGLRAIESIEIADLRNNGIRGVIEGSIPENIIGAPSRGKWLIDPIVFDCAYQLALVWVQESYDMMALPGDIKKYVQFRPYDGGPIHCDVYIKMVNYPKLIMDFNFADHAGVLFAQATDVVAIMNKSIQHKEADADTLKLDDTQGIEA